MVKQTNSRHEEASTTATSPTGGSRTRPGQDPSSRLGSALQPLWRDGRLGIVAGVAVAAPWGVVAAWWTPRGPLVTSEVLAAMLIGLLVGAAVGLVMRSRWAMLVAPVTFAVVFELARMGTDGPTVDAPVLSQYGIVGPGHRAWVPRTGRPHADGVGRCGRCRGRPPHLANLRCHDTIHDRCASPPRNSDRHRHRPRRRWRWFIARPASTEQILDADGEPARRQHRRAHHC